MMTSFYRKYTEGEILLYMMSIVMVNYVSCPASAFSCRDGWGGW